MSKLSRQKLISNLVQHEPVANQDELRLLLAKHGFKVTQATLSRDIRELGLVKTPDGYRLPSDVDQVESSLPSVERLIREFAFEVQEINNLLVVKTSAGSAQPVSAAIDAEEWPEVVGTIGGDDTILVISPDSRAAHRLAIRIKELIT